VDDVFDLDLMSSKTSLHCVEMSEAPLISIVDDDPLARDGIRELVESLGHRGVAFASAADFFGIWSERGDDMPDVRF